MNFLLDRSTVYISKLQWFMFSNERNISRFEYHRLYAIYPLIVEKVLTILLR